MLKKFIKKNIAAIGRVYRIFFYVLCILLLVSAVIKIGGVLDKKIGIGELRFRLDHILHGFAYFLFSMYYLTGQLFGLMLFRRRSHVLFFLLIFLLGIIAETIQIWVPYRSFSLIDLLSNLIGIVVGYFVTVYSIRRKAVGSRL